MSTAIDGAAEGEELHCFLFYWICLCSLVVVCFRILGWLWVILLQCVQYFRQLFLHVGSCRRILRRSSGHLHQYCVMNMCNIIFQSVQRIVGSSQNAILDGITGGFRLDKACPFEVRKVGF